MGQTGKDRSEIPSMVFSRWRKTRASTRPWPLAAGTAAILGASDPYDRTETDEDEPFATTVNPDTDFSVRSQSFWSQKAGPVR
jgi:hypothetical protein